jgi:hypothetical protein
MTLDVFEVKKNELYGSELPRSLEDFQTLKNMGIKIIISLTEEIRNYNQSEKIQSMFEWYEIFIVDYNVPSDAQIKEFITILEKCRKERKPVMIHCYAGCGRTGLMLALAEKLVYGVEDGQEAINNIRKVRSCAVENEKQQSFVINYYFVAYMLFYFTSSIFSSIIMPLSRNSLSICCDGTLNSWVTTPFFFISPLAIIWAIIDAGKAVIRIMEVRLFFTSK